MLARSPPAAAAAATEGATGVGIPGGFTTPSGDLDLLDELDDAGDAAGEVVSLWISIGLSLLGEAGLASAAVPNATESGSNTDACSRGAALAAAASVALAAGAKAIAGPGTLGRSLPFSIPSLKFQGVPTHASISSGSRLSSPSTLMLHPNTQPVAVETANMSLSSLLDSGKPLTHLGLYLLSELVCLTNTGVASGVICPW